MQTIMPISAARKKIFEITTQVQKPDAYCILTENGHPKAVIISAAEFASWQETLEVAKDFPHLEKEKAIAEKEYQAGEYLTLEDFLARQGYVTKNKKSQTKTCSDSSYPKKCKKKLSK